MRRMFKVSKRGGLTLIELIMALGLISVLTAALWVIYQAGFSTTYTQQTRSVIKGEAGRAFVRLVQELRQAASLTAANQTNLTLTFDTDGDGVDETVQYSWSGTSNAPLNRVSGATAPLVNSVSSLAFSYYDGSSNLLSFPVTASQVKMVAVNMTAATGDETFTLRSQGRLRNV